MRIIFLFILLQISSLNFAQQINWHSLDSSTKHLVFINGAWDYGLTLGVSYGYHFKSKQPLVLITDFSIPSGKKLEDDFKLKTGLNSRLYKRSDFQFSGVVYISHKRYENPLVTLNSIGSELNLLAGYYRKYFIAAEFGFDKTMVTHFAHTASFKENIYADTKNRWYRNTGGVFSIGLQTGYSFKKQDLSFKIGKAFNQDFKTSPLIPYYMKLSYALKIGK